MTRAKAALRVLLAGFVGIVGVMHFAHPTPFVRIVPAALPAPLLWVYLSGAAEVGLALLLLWERTRRIGALGMVALFVAVFPANVNQAVNGIQLDPARPAPGWVAWARLPLQAVLIAWAWGVRGDRRSAPAPRP